MSLQLYISPMIGTGLTQDDPRRPAFADVVKDYHGSDHAPRGLFLGCVIAPDATLNTIETIVGVIPVLPYRALNAAHYASILDTPFSSFPLVWRTAAQTALEARGFPCDKITGAVTMRQVLRVVQRLFNAAQIVDAEGNAAVKSLLGRGLDLTVSAIPVAERTAIGAWLQSKGINTAWIGATTTIREVLNSLPDNLDLLVGRKISTGLGGEAF